MALAFTARTSLGSTANAISYATDTGGDGDGTYAPAANSLLVTFVFSRGASGAPTSGVTGHGLTYTQVGTSVDFPTNAGDLSCWVADSGASPTDTATTAAWTVTNRTGCSISETEVPGADLSAGAAAAIVQTPTQASGSSTSAAVTFAAFGAADNLAAWALGKGNTEAVTSDWTALHAPTHTVPNSMLASFYKTVQDTTATGSWTTAVLRVAFGVEVKAAAAGISFEVGLIPVGF